MKKILFLIFFAPQIFAATIPEISSGGNILPGPRDEKVHEYFTENFLPAVTNKILIAILSISTILIIVAGVIYIFSSGESEMIKKAKDTIFWTIAGTILAILSFGIVKFFIGLDFSIDGGGNQENQENNSDTIDFFKENF